MITELFGESVFSKKPSNSPQVDVSFCNPTRNTQRELLLSTFSPSFAVACVLDFGHSDLYVVISCFSLLYCNDMWCGVSFSCLFVIRMSSLVKGLLRSVAHFCTRVVWALIVLNLLCFLINLWISLSSSTKENKEPVEILIGTTLIL